MKTAMQELIEAVNKHYSNSLRTDIFDTNPFLEKEKEQIIESFCSGVYEGIWSDINDNTKNENAEEYYNRTYNKN